jgi:hypothetical protein
VPGRTPLCRTDTPNYPKWTSLDVILWKILPERFGGGAPFSTTYKNSWIVFRRRDIFRIANENNIPADLLAGVAFAELGGKPDGMKSNVVLPTRQFDWSGPDWIDRNLTITKPPEFTSIGSLAIQLREAAPYVGFSHRHLSTAQQDALVRCLKTDILNLSIVAQHLHALILFDFPGADTRNIDEKQIILVGSRYNRGTERDKEDFLESIAARPGSSQRAYTEYGRAMLKHRDHIRQLLGLPP